MDNLAKLYEDACILCAGVWFASSSSVLGGGEGTIRLEGEDELRTRTGAGTYGRNKGMSVESPTFGTERDGSEELGRRRTGSGSTYVAPVAVGEDGMPMTTPAGKSKSGRMARRQSTGASSMWSLPLSWTWTSTPRANANSKELYTDTSSWEDVSGPVFNDAEDDGEQYERLRARREVDVALAVLRAFQTHSVRLLAKLGDTLAPHLKLKPLKADAPQPANTNAVNPRAGKNAKAKDPAVATLTLTPKDLLALDLGPLSTMDARFVEWLADAYFVVPSDSGSTSSSRATNEQGMKVVVRKPRWRDVVGVVFGF